MKRKRQGLQLGAKKKKQKKELRLIPSDVDHDDVANNVLINEQQMESSKFFQQLHSGMVHGTDKGCPVNVPAAILHTVLDLDAKLRADAKYVPSTAKTNAELCRVASAANQLSLEVTLDRVCEVLAKRRDKVVRKVKSNTSTDQIESIVDTFLPPLPLGPLSALILPQSVFADVSGATSKSLPPLLVAPVSLVSEQKTYLDEQQKTSKNVPNAV